MEIGIANIRGIILVGVIFVKKPILLTRVTSPFPTAESDVVDDDGVARVDRVLVDCCSGREFILHDENPILTVLESRDVADEATEIFLSKDVTDEEVGMLVGWIISTVGLEGWIISTAGFAGWIISTAGFAGWIISTAGLA